MFAFEFVRLCVSRAFVCVSMCVDLCLSVFVFVGACVCCV